ncbi:MAG: LCP family protein [Actinomycetota bacterium]|nr:LCP family protein [Actinomycetota bacterium]
MWRRLLIGALLVVFASATATAAAGLREIDRLVTAFRDGEILDLGQSLVEAEAGEPQTIMLIGSDERPRWSPNYEDKARSDSILLVRLDPARGATAIMSLPRDLKVTVPGFGTRKLNNAYEEGGPRLALETVKKLTGLRINHVINVDFDGFQRGVNALGCIYADIDRRYFNDNSGVEDYATIDVPPGYQRMCGKDSLDYVRYRHDDNDLVRAARQQEYLRQVKQQVSVGELISDRERLIQIFGRYSSSDIRSRAEVVRLAKLAVASAGGPVHEVHFKGELGATYVTASSAAIRELTREFLGVKATKGPRGDAPEEGRASRERRPRRRRATPVPLEDVSVEGRMQGAVALRRGARIPVYYPTSRAPRSRFDGQPRVYDLRGPDGRHYSSYRMVLKANEVGQYYGVQGTAWKEAPILSGPAEQRRRRGRTFEVFKDGDRVRLVAWRTREAVYWISNTLFQSLSEGQMLAIAESTRRL